MVIRFLADDSLLNPEDVAALLGVSRPFVCKLMDTGELPVAAQNGTLRKVAASAAVAWRETQHRRVGEADRIAGAAEKEPTRTRAERHAVPAQADAHGSDADAMPTAHLPVAGTLTIGGWSIEVFCEQRLSLDPPAEDMFVGVVHGRIRIAVVDPALNDVFCGRAEVAAHAWGRVLGYLRTVAEPAAALEAANAAVFDPALPWMAGPMLCVAVVDLDPLQPLAVRSVRAGDTEVFLDRPVLTGSCFTAEANSRLAAARSAVGVGGSDPRRWAIQQAELSLADYACTPLGLAAVPRLQTWGPVRAVTAAVTTDGALTSSGDSLLLDAEALTRVCGQAPARQGAASPHGDRAVVVARFVGLTT